MKSTNSSLPDNVAALIPYDKSWLMRLGLLDLLNGKPAMHLFLAKHQDNLSTDLQALARASRQWQDGQDIDVGESGTLFRFLMFAAWKRGEEHTFIKRGTLADRAITDDRSIVDLPLKELLKLDNGTSQWASAAVLMGNIEEPPVPTPYKLKLTYQAKQHWEESQKRGEHWHARKDETLTRQTQAYLHWKQTNQIDFVPEQAEDYCFARAFGLLTAEEGEARWPALRQHESDRINEMERALAEKSVSSSDHRVIQAVAMLKGYKVKYRYPKAVAKSWPRFWDLIDINT